MSDVRVRPLALTGLRHLHHGDPDYIFLTTLT